MRARGRERETLEFSKLQVKCASQVKNENGTPNEQEMNKQQSTKFVSN